MRYDYDKEKKVVKLDGESDLIVSKNKNYAVYLTEDFTANNDFTVEMSNYYVTTSYKQGFKSKLRHSLLVLKFIWSK